jgi:hypothetical protein
MTPEQKARKRETCQRWYKANKDRQLANLTPARKARKLEAMRRWRKANKKRANELTQRWRKANNERHRENERRCRYDGIDYKAIFAAQNGACAICQGRPKAGRSLDIDHCHTSGKVRGLLCGKCNKAIGGFADNPELLRTAADYLERHLAKEAA